MTGWVKEEHVSGLFSLPDNAWLFVLKEANLTV